MRRRVFFAALAVWSSVCNFALAQTDIAAVPGLPASVTHGQLKVSEPVLNAHSRIPISSSRDANEFQPDTARHAFIDTDYINFSWWPSSIGGDLFLSAGFYGLHLTGVGSLTNDVGLGGEARVYSFVLGGMYGISGDEGIHPIPPSGIFSFYSLYAGVIVGSYRCEIGETHADSQGWIDEQSGNASYSSGFLGISRRWGRAFFFETGAKVVLPLASMGYVGSRFPPEQWFHFREHYRLQDLFFGLSVKVGIGIN